MGKFRVEHAAVANIGKGQKRLGVDAKKTEAYISKHASLSWNEAVSSTTSVPDTTR